MIQTRLAWNAVKNMARMAVRDPLWAITALALAPFRHLKRVLWATAGITLASAVIMLVSLSTLNALGFGKGSLPWLVFNILLPLFPISLTYRLLTNALIVSFGDLSEPTHGSARFAIAKEIAPLKVARSGLLIGRDPKTRKLLRHTGPAHLLTIAPTRTGKGVGTIIPNLLVADRSIICVDPKGENARIAGRARQSFGPVHVLDPFSVTGVKSAAFNPLDMLELDGVDVAEDAHALADALVFDEPGLSGEAHWNEEAKALISGLLLMIVAFEPPDRKHLATLREYLTLPPDRFNTLLVRMQEQDGVNGLVARAANRHIGKSDREAAGVLSSAQRHTHFLDSPRMTGVLERTDFRFADLKQRRATVFLVLPPERLSTYARWLRLLISQSLSDMTRGPGTPDEPVLYLLDEFAALGHLAPIERAMGLMAGYGVQLWPILQDIHQLRATYGGMAGTFISNSGVLQIFGVNDHDTARLVSDLLGQETIVFQTMARALDSENTGITFSQQRTGRPLLTPDEVRNLPPDSQLLLLTGQRPIFAGKIAYYRDPEFRGLFHQS
ncbi:type IV secretory system conjugative DNA transfer family protein [Neorhizobium sp. T786]|uniref:type IV secretory system conjugative DNA transfer family protein n=1 Tax=Pseudorhizobium xiangyangii TaxID=2883104 RepID=UPI001CFFE655|nr:type IV secretory system conjugative DNA transfer family protein [Neorhizobium xiangyangii]MCB5205456.1 type IV secretory system conjugative DNA transfer family protein [Neorhizobium xiangyangii]